MQSRIAQRSRNFPTSQDVFRQTDLNPTTPQLFPHREQIMLKYVLTLAALAFLLAPAPTLAGTVPVEGEGDPALYVVKVHADWCGSCTALVPIPRRSPSRGSRPSRPLPPIGRHRLNADIPSPPACRSPRRRRPLQGQQQNRPRPAHQRRRPHPAGNGDQAKLRR